MEHAARSLKMMTPVLQEARNGHKAEVGGTFDRKSLKARNFRNKDLEVRLC